MKLIVLVLLSLCTACALTPTERKVAVIGAAIVVTGAIAAHNVDHDGHRGINPPDCINNPDSCR